MATTIGSDHARASVWPGRIFATALAVTVFVLGSSLGMFVVWVLVDRVLPDRQLIASIVEDAGLSSAGITDVTRYDYLFGSEFDGLGPVLLGSDEYGPGYVKVWVDAGGPELKQRLDNVGSAFTGAGWHAPARGETRPYGVLKLGNDDVDMVLYGYTDEPATAVFELSRQSPTAVLPVGLLAGVTSVVIAVRRAGWPMRHGGKARLSLSLAGS